MVDVNEFCNRLVDDFVAYFKKIQVTRLITQSRVSCRYIIDKCVEYNPDYVLDIGTNYGMSALSQAYALKSLQRDISSLTTFDCVHEHWTRETPDIQSRNPYENLENYAELKKNFAGTRWEKFFIL